MPPFFKKTLLLLFGLISISCSGIDIDVFKQFGEESFNRQKWLDGDEMVKGKMVYDFLKKNTPIKQQNGASIVAQLGEHTGYYLYDHFPAYYIGPKPPNSNAKAYLLAFVLDQETNQVKEIYLHPKL